MIVKEEILKIIILIMSLLGLLFVFYYFYDSLNDDLEWTGIAVSKKAPDQFNNSFPENYTNEIMPNDPKLLFFGDLMIDRHVGEKIEAKGMDYIFEKLFLDASSTLKLSDYDLVSANLEGAVTDAGAHYSPVNAYDFAFAPKRVEQLKDYGFNFFNLANNHFSDQGERGIIETRKNLDELEIPYVGCKDREVAECSKKILEINGYKVGMAGFSQVYGLLNIEETKSAVEDLASTSNLVIVNIHWGAEYQHVNNRIQASVAHDLIDSGADIIIGHHPHVVQGMEIYGGRPIFYSLGNFVFDQYFSEATQRGLALALLISDEQIEINLLPLESKASQVSLSLDKNKAKAINDVVSWSSLDDEYIEGLKNGKLIFDY